METKTKYFGTISYEAEDIITFPDGIIGFEEETAFLLLPFKGSEGKLLCFQSLKTPGLAFVAMDPFSLNPEYRPILAEEELSLMEVSRSEDVFYYALCAVREPVSETTVNFKCPIVYNDHTQKAMQVILQTGDYQMRHRLGDFPKGGASPC